MISLAVPCWKYWLLHWLSTVCRYDIFGRTMLKVLATPLTFHCILVWYLWPVPCLKHWHMLVLCIRIGHLTVQMDIKPVACVYISRSLWGQQGAGHSSVVECMIKIWWIIGSVSFSGLIKLFFIPASSPQLV